MNEAEPFVTALDLSNFAGLTAIGLLTLNILMGLLLVRKYNPVRNWPHRRVNTVRLHNWTGYTALAAALVHPALLVASATEKFGLIDVLWPLNAPKQPWVTSLGALALYLLVFVVITSVLYQEWHVIPRAAWKKMHLATYAMFPVYAVHSVLTDPALKDRPIDYLDGEKVFVEACILLVLIAIGVRVQWQRHQPPARVHRARQPAQSVAQR